MISTAGKAQKRAEWFKRYSRGSGADSRVFPTAGKKNIIQPRNGEFHARDSFDHHFDPVVDWRIAFLAPQPGMGLLSEWRTRSDRHHCNHFTLARSFVKPARREEYASNPEK